MWAICGDDYEPPAPKAGCLYFLRYFWWRDFLLYSTIPGSSRRSASKTGTSLTHETLPSVLPWAPPGFVLTSQLGSRSLLVASTAHSVARYIFPALPFHLFLAKYVIPPTTK